MIYEQIRDELLTFLKAPRQPPDPPAGSRESVQVFRAAPNFLRYQVVVWGAGFALGILAEVIFIVVGHGHEKLGWAELALGYVALVATVLGSVVKYFLIRIDYDMRYYVVTDRSLRIRQGALLIDELSNLVVETAGGAGGGGKEGRENPFRRGHEGRLRGVANAREVRDQILKLLKRYRDAGLGDPEDRRRATPVSPLAGGLSPQGLARLREVRDELRQLRQTVGP
ncbi:MAG: hypothetical protein ACYSUA_16695 [Planctomycetota bacterium]